MIIESPNWNYGDLDQRDKRDLFSFKIQFVTYLGNVLNLGT